MNHMSISKIISAAVAALFANGSKGIHWVRPTLEIFLFHLTRPCFSGVSRSVGILFYFYFLRFYID